MMNIHGLSKVTALVRVLSNDGSVNQGTGFFYLHDEEVFLITNYHVISGGVPPQQKNDAQAKVERIEIYLRKRGGGKYILELPLTHCGNNLWIEHPNIDVDIVALPILRPRLSLADFKTISKELVSDDIKVFPSSNAVLIGYPVAYHDSLNRLPIWKTGSIASEPDVDFDGKKLILLDVSSFPGMSGSPALYVTQSGYMGKDGMMVMSPDFICSFLGVFASTMEWTTQLVIKNDQGDVVNTVDHKENMQIGHIWKASLIEDVLEGFDLASYLSILDPIKSGFIVREG